MTASTRTTHGAALLAALALSASASAGTPATAPESPLERVVVTGAGAASAVLSAGGRQVEQLALIGGVSALLPRGARLPGSLQVMPDRPLSVAAGGSAPTGTAAPVREVLGLGAPRGEGAGTTVAVVDTGVASGLPDLPDDRVTHVSVTGSPGVDSLGHGTFVAGLVAGSGASTGGRYAGVAPAASVLDVKVAEADGGTSLATVLRGLQAVADHGDVDVVNLSLGSESPLPYGLDPLALALDELWRQGIVVVVPSGNTASTVSSPGTDPRLLTLGGLADGGTAARDDDTVAPWSGRGRNKPDLVAPGASVVSLLAPGSAAADGQVHPSPAPGYGVGSGTSFATGVASGAAAALLGERPLSPDQVKDLLTGTAYRAPGLRDGRGAGGLDLAAARTAPAPRDSGSSRGPGLPAADRAVWDEHVAALLDGDTETAARTWALLSPQARTWAARTWAARTWAARTWADLTPEARTWAARTWAARTWADLTPQARTWAARTWAARTWAARTWAADSWS